MESVVPRDQQAQANNNQQQQAAVFMVREAGPQIQAIPVLNTSVAAVARVAAYHMSGMVESLIGESQQQQAHISDLTQEIERLNHRVNIHRRALNDVSRQRDRLRQRLRASRTRVRELEQASGNSLAFDRPRRNNHREMVDISSDTSSEDVPSVLIERGRSPAPEVQLPRIVPAREVEEEKGEPAELVPSGLVAIGDLMADEWELPSASEMSSGSHEPLSLAFRQAAARLANEIAEADASAEYERDRRAYENMAEARLIDEMSRQGDAIINDQLLPQVAGHRFCGSVNNFFVPRGVFIEDERIQNVVRNTEFLIGFGPFLRVPPVEDADTNAQSQILVRDLEDYKLPLQNSRCCPSVSAGVVFYHRNLSDAYLRRHHEQLSRITLGGRKRLEDEVGGTTMELAIPEATQFAQNMYGVYNHGEEILERHTEYANQQAMPIYNSSSRGRLTYLHANRERLMQFYLAGQLFSEIWGSQSGGEFEFSQQHELHARQPILGFILGQHHVEQLTAPYRDVFSHYLYLNNPMYDHSASPSSMIRDINEMMDLNDHAVAPYQMAIWLDVVVQNRVNNQFSTFYHCAHPRFVGSAQWHADMLGEMREPERELVPYRWWPYAKTSAGVNHSSQSTYPLQLVTARAGIVDDTRTWTLRSDSENQTFHPLVPLCGRQQRVITYVPVMWQGHWTMAIIIDNWRGPAIQWLQDFEVLIYEPNFVSPSSRAGPKITHMEALVKHVTRMVLSARLGEPQGRNVHFGAGNLQHKFRIVCNFFYQVASDQCGLACMALASYFQQKLSVIQDQREFTQFVDLLTIPLLAPSNNMKLDDNYPLRQDPALFLRNDINNLGAAFTAHQIEACMLWGENVSGSRARPQTSQWREYEKLVALPEGRRNVVAATLMQGDVPAALNNSLADKMTRLTLNSGYFHSFIARVDTLIANGAALMLLNRVISPVSYEGGQMRFRNTVRLPNNYRPALNPASAWIVRATEDFQMERVLAGSQLRSWTHWREQCPAELDAVSFRLSQMVGCGGVLPGDTTEYTGALFYCATMYRLLQHSAQDAREYHEWAISREFYGDVRTLLKSGAARTAFITMLKQNLLVLDADEWAEARKIPYICEVVLLRMSTHIAQIPRLNA